MRYQAIQRLAVIYVGYRTLKGAVSETRWSRVLLTYFHVWFGTRGRRWLLLSEIEERAKELLWEIAQENGIRLLECEAMVEHMHLLLEIPPEALPKAMNKLKGISSRRLFQRFPELKLDAQVNHFWQKRYGAKAVAPDAPERVRRYIKTQKERPERYDRVRSDRDAGPIPHP